MSKSPTEYLRHILDEADYLIAACRGLDRDRFMADATLMRAFTRSLEIIGEAASKLPPDFRSSRPEVEWRSIVAMRNRLVHGYFEVNYRIVWDVAHNEVPLLKTQVEQILDETTSEEE